jgi:hypothetical protein
VGFEPKVSAGERPQTYALDRAAIGSGIKLPLVPQNIKWFIGEDFFSLNFAYANVAIYMLINLTFRTCMCMLLNLLSTTVENCHLHNLGFQLGWYRLAWSVFFTLSSVVQTIGQVCTYPWLQLAMATKLRTASRNICGSSVLNPLRVSLLTYRILSSLLDFENLYNPVVCYSAILPLNISFHRPPSIIFHAIYLFNVCRAEQSSRCLTNRSATGSTIFSSRLRKMHNIVEVRFLLLQVKWKNTMRAVPPEGIPTLT